MTKVVGDVAIEVGADIGPLVREMGRGVGVLDRFDGAAKKLGRGLDRFADKTAALGAKLSIVSAAMAAIAGAAFILAKNAATLGDEIGDSAKAAGMSTTAFQEYRFALKEAAAMSDEEFASAAAKLNKTLGEARTGSEAAAKAFEAIGVSQAQIADGSFTVDQAMAAFVAKMEATKDPATAAAIATDLFGKSGARLGSSLSGVPGQVGSLVDRARELGVVMGPEAVQAAGKFDQKMNELGAQFEAVKMKIAEVLLPVIVDKLIPILQEKLLPALVEVAEKVADWVDAFAALDPAVQGVVLAITAAFAVGGPVLLAISGIATAIGALIAGPAAPFILFVAAIAGVATAFPAVGSAAYDAFVILGGSVTGALELIGKLIVAIGEAEQAFVDLFNAAVKMTGISAMTPDYGAPDNNLGVGPISPQAPGGNTGGMGDLPGGGSDVVGGAMGGQMMGAAIVNGMLLGAVDSLNKNREALMATFAQVPQIARDVLGIQSPSTVFAEIGKFLGLGMAQGITDSTPVVKTAMDGMTGQAVAGAQEGVTGVLSAMSGLFQGSKKISAGIALVNSWLAFTEVLKDPAFIGRPWARIGAAVAALTPGLQAVKNIKAAQPGGTGGGGTSASGIAQPSGAGGIANITLVGDTFSRGSVEELFGQINEGLRAGRTINLVRT